MDFGILAQWLTLLRMGLLGIFACKDTTCSPKNSKLSTSALENST